MTRYIKTANRILGWSKKLAEHLPLFGWAAILLVPILDARSGEPTVQLRSETRIPAQRDDAFQTTLVQAVPPSLLFRDGTGKVIDVSEKKGKVIFINFWATWCPPCVAEMPSINRLYEQYKANENVLFIMVDVDSDYAKAQKFLKRKQLNLPLYIPAGPIPSNMLGSSIPCTVVLDKAGKMAFRHEGAADYDNKKFKDAMQRLIEE